MLCGSTRAGACWHLHYMTGLEKYSRPILRDQVHDQDRQCRDQDQDQDRQKTVSSGLETKTAVSRTTSLPSSTLLVTSQCCGTVSRQLTKASNLRNILVQLRTVPLWRKRTEKIGYLNKNQNSSISSNSRIVSVCHCSFRYYCLPHTPTR